jgi:NtrC-family two-component system sensor histidine kinase KinB
MRLGLRTRIVLTLLPPLVLLAALGCAGAVLLYRLGGSIDLILRENYASVIAMERLNEAVERIDSSFQFTLSGKEKDAREQYRENWKLYQEALQTEENNITLPGEAELVQELAELTQRYRQQGEDFYAPATPLPKRQALYFGGADRPGLLSTFRDIKRVSGQIARINQQNMEGASLQSRSLASKSLVWFAAGLAGAVLLAILLTLYTGRTILGPIQSLTQAARGISAGNLDQVVPYLSSDELGDLAYAFNTMARHLRDIRMSHMSRLLRAQRTSQASIDSFPDPVLVVDSEGHVEMANPAAQRILGVATRERRGVIDDREERAPLPWQAPEALREPLAAALKHQQTYLPEGFDRALLLRLDGRELFFLPRILAIRDPYGNTLGAAVHLQDVTRFRLLDEVKSNLVATVSHELKTPLTGVRLALHLLLEEAAGPLTPKQLELLVDARDNAELLLARVNSLLDLTRLEAGSAQLDLARESAADVLRAAADVARPRAEAKGVQLVTEVPADLPLVVADAARLGHALGNLLDNAVTYTDRGGRITLSAARTDQGVTFSVQDTGMGIPPEYLPRVFDRFFRVPDRTRGSGTGLGLAIAREIILDHGGTLSCESTPGVGTTFRFTLPVAAQDADPTAEPAVPSALHS